MKNIKANKNTLIRWKVYIDRAKMYIGYIQFIMLGLVLLETYRETGLGSWVFNNLLISVPLILLLFVATALVIGRLDTIWGFREEELRNSAVSNPVTREILSNLEEINDQLKGLKE